MPEFSEFSEFSYGYALVDNLAHNSSWGEQIGAPQFISLFEEGSEGGGFDVALDFVAWPFFLQFKIPQIMRRRSSGPKGMPPGFITPYLRMRLRTERVNASGMTQHEQLIELEQQNPLSVFYVSPRFHTTEKLDQHYLSKRVPDESEWFSLCGFDPANPLTREPHRIAYGTAPDMCVIQSKPVPFEQRLKFKTVADRFITKIRGSSPMHPEIWLNNLENTIADVIDGRSLAKTIDARQRSDSEIQNKKLRFLSHEERKEFYGRLQKVARTVRTRLDTELILAMPRGAPSNAQ